MLDSYYGIEDTELLSPWLLRFELDKTEKILHKLTMSIIVEKLKVSISATWC
jgi:hypothetical protein